jgi:hypothetical protein
LYNKLVDGKFASDHRAIFSTQNISKVKSELIGLLSGNDNETSCPFITTTDITSTHTGTAYDDTLSDDLNMTRHARINVTSRCVRIPTVVAGKQ